MYSYRRRRSIVSLGEAQKRFHIVTAERKELVINFYNLLVFPRNLLGEILTLFVLISL
jgi:hypothetical protein